MAVQVQQPNRQRRDLFDLVIGGLQAASAFTNIQKARAELEAIPKLAEETKIEKAETLLKEQEKIARQTQKERFEQFGKVQDKFKQNKDFQKASTKVFDAGTLLNLGREALAGNQPAFEQMKVIIARMNQGGVLTDRDIATLGGSQEFSQVFKRFVDTRLVGEVRRADVEDLLDVAAAAKDSGVQTAQQIREGILSRELKRFQAAGIESVTKEQLEQITDLNDLIEAAKKSEFPTRITPKRRKGIIPPRRTPAPKVLPSLDEQLQEFDSLLE